MRARAHDRVHAALLGFRPAPKPRARKCKPAKPLRGLRDKPELTEAQRHERDCERAFRCGARYSANHRVRRPPPRMRGPAGGRFGEVVRDLQRAFYRGYDQATRARIAYLRPWGFWPAERRQAVS